MKAFSSLFNSWMMGVRVGPQLWLEFLHNNIWIKIFKNLLKYQWARKVATFVKAPWGEPLKFKYVQIMIPVGQVGLQCGVKFLHRNFWRKIYMNLLEKILARKCYLCRTIVRNSGWNFYIRADPKTWPWASFVFALGRLGSALGLLGVSY